MASLFPDPPANPGEPPRGVPLLPPSIVKDMPTNLVKTGGEFWKIFVIALILAYTIEAIAGFLATARRERERAPEMEVAA